jgi:glycine cleavage system regulatory protein
MASTSHLSTSTIRKIIKDLEQRQGCTVTMTKRSVYKVRTPDGRVVVTHFSTSDRRGWLNNVSLFRRFGLELKL